MGFDASLQSAIHEFLLRVTGRTCASPGSKFKFEDESIVLDWAHPNYDLNSLLGPELIYSAMVVGP